MTDGPKFWTSDGKARPAQEAPKPAPPPKPVAAPAPAPVAVSVAQAFPPADGPEQTVGTFHPKISSSYLVIGVLLIFFSGLGLIILLFAWLDSKGQRLVVTTRRVTYRKGIVSELSTEVFMRDIRNVIIERSLSDKMCGRGSITISTTGQGEMPIGIRGVSESDLEQIKLAVDHYRHA